MLDWDLKLKPGKLMRCLRFQKRRQWSPDRLALHLSTLGFARTVIYGALKKLVITAAHDLGENPTSVGLRTDSRFLETSYIRLEIENRAVPKEKPIFKPQVHHQNCLFLRCPESLAASATEVFEANSSQAPGYSMRVTVMHFSCLGQALKVRKGSVYFIFIHVYIYI